MLPEQNRNSYERGERNLTPLSIMRYLSRMIRFSRMPGVLENERGSRNYGGSRELKRANGQLYYAGSENYKTACSQKNFFCGKSLYIPFRFFVNAHSILYLTNVLGRGISKRREWLIRYGSFAADFPGTRQNPTNILSQGIFPFGAGTTSSYS